MRNHVTIASNQSESFVIIQTESDNYGSRTEATKPNVENTEIEVDFGDIAKVDLKAKITGHAN